MKNGSLMSGLPQADPQQYDKSYGDMKSMRQTMGMGQGGMPFSHPNMGRPPLQTFLPHPNWAPSVEGDPAIGAPSSFNLHGAGGMMPSQQEMQAMSSPFQTPAMSMNAARALEQDAREAREARRGDPLAGVYPSGRAAASSPSRSPDGLRSTRALPEALGPVLRRLEEIEIKNQRDREQLNVWKETQEVSLRKLEIQMGQLMRAVHSLIHISQTAIDNRVHRDQDRGEQAAPATLDTKDQGSRQEAHRKETSPIHSDYYAEKKGEMMKSANPFEDGGWGAPPEAFTSMDTSGPQTHPSIVVTSPPQAPLSPQDPSPKAIEPKSEAEIPEASASVDTRTVTLLPATVIYDWDIKPSEWTRYRDVFIRQDTDKDGYVDAPRLLALVTRSKIPRQQLVNIIALCDLDRDGRFTEEEFILATHMVTKVRQGFEIPTSLPPVLRAAAMEKMSGRTQGGEG